MTLRRGYALLAALVAVVAALSVGIVLLARTPASAVRSELARPSVWVGTWAAAPGARSRGRHAGSPEAP